MDVTSEGQRFGVAPLVRDPLVRGFFVRDPLVRDSFVRDFLVRDTRSSEDLWSEEHIRQRTLWSEEPFGQRFLWSEEPFGQSPIGQRALFVRVF